MFILSTRFSNLKFNTYIDAALAEMDQRQVEALEMLDRYQQAAPYIRIQFSLVERVIWDHEVTGSNPVIRTSINLYLRTY